MVRADSRGNGEAIAFVDAKANDKQREALLKIMTAAFFRDAAEGLADFTAHLLMLRDGAVVIAAGISLGLVLRAIALRMASNVVRSLPTFDTAVFVAVLPAFVVVLVACLFPALRASRIDPAQVIRGE